MKKQSVSKGLDVADLRPMVEARFDSLIHTWDEGRHETPNISFAHAERARGIHASSLLSSDKDFCYREQIYSLHFEPTAVRLHGDLLRIFLEGHFVHMKWQMLFTISGMATSIEKHGHNEETNLHYTPDAVINMFKRSWVVEIKSMNTFAFQKLTKPPAAAVAQCNIYMMEEQVDQGIILVEDKNNQKFKAWPISYSSDETARPVKRLRTINKLVSVFQKETRLPKRICSSKEVGRAKRCQFAERCFG